MNASPPTWTPKPGMTWLFDIDIIGGCNLACPSCPIGNSRDVRNAKGAMPPELLQKIVDKAVAECGVVEFDLFNWTEPFLHPQLPAMVRIVRSAGSKCSLSTNLNLVRDLDAVLREDPSQIKISLSGFSQESYGKTHQNGDIEVVKQHMTELAEACTRLGARTHVRVGFHRYLGNHDEEVQMREFSESLGFEFDPQWAYLMPLEKVLAFADETATDVRLNDDDKWVIDHLALPLDAALEISRNSPPGPCRLRDRQMALTVTGEVMLCCVVFDQSKYALGSYLDRPLDEFQQMKYRHRQCGTCMNHGLHKFFTYADEELDDAALANVRRHYPQTRLQGTLEIVRQRRYAGVMGFARRVKDLVLGRRPQL